MADDNQYYCLATPPTTYVQAHIDFTSPVNLGRRGRSPCNNI